MTPSNITGTHLELETSGNWYALFKNKYIFTFHCPLCENKYFFYI